ncbi:iron complex transport system ATP-binding protein [Dongia mobilis]|uniref:Iron complex transport system ATP-binding protein n=1 Tax=Dongia mobilis TaxID=578943 RepID=A0A4R6WN04_9PROT|nr:ABC transporter ATP-binding protein [Dongia mobilis]TDQ82283.1 iron complex transport system ATP-binding protein [Dongia mobilis]
MSIATHNLRWEAGGRLIVDGVTLNAVPGRMLGLVGPNGSGKSSLLRLIGGLRRASAGLVTLGDCDMRTLPRPAIARRIAFVAQQAATEEDVTVEDVVRLGRTPHRGPLAGWTGRDQQAVDQALMQTGLAAKRRQSWHTLSGGEKQRAQIARALAQAPTELLLDEPTNHLDVQHQLEILELVSHLPLTSIVALHDLNLAALYCDEVVVLMAGRVMAAGAPLKVLTPSLIRTVFGVAAAIGRSPIDGRPHLYLAPVAAAVQPVSEHLRQSA